MTNAWSIFVLNASPTNAADSSSQRSRPPRMALEQAHTASTSSNTSSVSGLLSRFTATAIGVSVSATAAMIAATYPKPRRTT